MALMYDDGEEYYTSYSDAYEENIDYVWSIQQSNNSSGTNEWVRVYDVVTNPATPALMLDSRNASVDGGTLTERRKRSESPAAFNQAAWFSDSITQAEINNIPPPATKQLPTIQQEGKSAVAPFEDTLGQSESAGVVETAEITTGRAAVRAFSQAHPNLLKLPRFALKILARFQNNTTCSLASIDRI